MPFAFVHIPKTAGRAFAGIIEQHTGVKTAPYKLMYHYFNTEVGGYDFYRGHTFLPALKHVLPKETQYMTLLRDPINRAYSHWRHLVDENVYHYYGLNFPPTFSEFIRCPETCALASNFQLRYLTLDPCDSVIAVGGRNRALAWQHSLERRALLAREDALIDKAMYELSKFAMVGTQEDFASAVICACLTMGYSPPVGVETKKTDYYDLISTDDLEFLMENNVGDWRIYNAYKR